MPAGRQLAFWVLMLFGVGGQAAEPIRDYVWFLRQIVSLDRLPYLDDEAVVTRQFSSYSRASHYDREKGECVGMDANGDAKHCMSVHFGSPAAGELAAFKLPASAPRVPFGDLQWILDPLERNHVFFLPRPGLSKAVAKPPENVVACISGPGCIYRIWSADPRGKIRFYFDGSTTPMEFDFRSLFSKGQADPDAETLARRAQWPFIRPLVYQKATEAEHAASDCYLPIPFAKSCVVALTEPSFYHFGYKQFPAGTQVNTFRLPLTTAEDAVLADVCRAFSARGSDPKPARPGSVEIARTVAVPPGKEVTLADLVGPGTIEALHIKLDGQERYAGSKVLLLGSFDDEPQPCIWSPLVNFFGTGFVAKDYRSYPLGYVDGEGYSYWPMPFRKRAQLVVRNEGRQPATLRYRVRHAPLASLPDTTMLFHCKYRREETCSTFDYPFLECQGRGRLVGVHLSIDDAWRSWWGEGDEKLWVDDDRFPSFFGTGSEDFFGDAWGIRPIHETFFACSQLDATPEHFWTCCYRWLVPDDVVFRKQLRLTIENYPESIFGTTAVEWDEDYVSTAYWYQLPGGSDFFKPVPVAQRRPWGKVPQPLVVEAEELFAKRLQQGAQLVDDEKLPHEFSKGLAIDLGAVRPGDELLLRAPQQTALTAYTLIVHTQRGLADLAAFAVFYQGQEICATPAQYGQSDACPLGPVVLAAGQPELTIRFTSAGRAVFDCFQFLPARQLRQVVEAEKAKQLSRQGPEPVREMGVAWSGGHQLRFPAAKPGDYIELETAFPPHGWDLFVGLTRGPGYGQYEVLVNNQRVALLDGYASEQQIADNIKLGTVSCREGQARVKLVCVGKQAAATGFALGLDYLAWKQIIVPYAIEAETAPTADVRDGKITTQKLGRKFSGEEQLWFRPRKVGASFAWLLDVPAEARYELAVYFTKSHDYGKVRISLDGKDLGEFDGYAPQVEWSGKTALGTHALSAGQHRLVFEVIGHNERSKGILVGIDCLTLKKVRK